MRDFARGVKKRSGRDQDNNIGEPSHALSLREALQMANAILSRPNRRFGIMEAVRLAHAKGWEEAELTGLAAQVAARMRAQLTKAERTLRNSGHHDQADEIRGVLQTDPLQPEGYIH
jgi:hypothetical protein